MGFSAELGDKGKRGIKFEIQRFDQSNWEGGVTSFCGEKIFRKGIFLTYYYYYYYFGEGNNSGHVKFWMPDGYLKRNI